MDADANMQWFDAWFRCTRRIALVNGHLNGNRTLCRIERAGKLDQEGVTDGLDLFPGRDCNLLPHEAIVYFE